MPYVLWTVLFAPGLAAAGNLSQASLVLLDGQPSPARLVSVDSSQATFSDGKQSEQTVALSRLVYWGGMVDPVKSAQLLLTDGSLLIGQIESIDTGHVILASSIWGEVTVPREQVVGVVWQPPAQQLARWRLRDRWRAVRGGQGVLTLANEDQLQGRLVDMADGRVRYETAAGTASLKMDGVISWRAADRLPVGSRNVARTTRLGLHDGSLLIAGAVQLNEDLRVRLRCGVSLTTLPEIEPSQEGLVSFWQPANPAVQFLSDLKPSATSIFRC